jgi:hypothetical protein
VKRLDEERHEIAREIQRSARKFPFKLRETSAQHDPETGEKNAREEMQRCVGSPANAIDLKTTRQAEHWDGEQPKGIPVSERRQDRFAPRRLARPMMIRENAAAVQNRTNIPQRMRGATSMICRLMITGRSRGNEVLTSRQKSETPHVGSYQ